MKLCRLHIVLGVNHLGVFIMPLTTLVMVAFATIDILLIATLVVLGVRS